MRLAVVAMAHELTPEQRAAIMLDRDSYSNYRRDVYQLAERLGETLDPKVTAEQIDARLSIAHPPVPVEPDGGYDGRHEWADKGLGQPARVWHQARGRLGVEFGNMPVDPFAVRIDPRRMAHSLGKRGDGLTGSLRRTEGRGRALWAGYLFMVVTDPPRKGSGTRYLRAWCRLLKAYGAQPVFVAEAVGPQGQAWLEELERRGEVQINSREGSYLFVRCELALEDPRQQVMFYPGRKNNPAAPHWGDSPFW